MIKINKKIIRNNRNIIGYSVATLLPLLIFFCLNNFEAPLISFPLAYFGDYLEFISLVKAMLPSSGGAINAPIEGISYSLTNLSGYNFFSFFVYIMHFLSSNPTVITNIYYILTFSFTSISFVFLSRYFNVPFNISIPISMLYSFMPFHYMRNTGHLMEMSYYFVPLQILIIFWLWRKTTPFFSKSGYSLLIFGKKEIFIYLVVVFLLPTSHYYMFMFLFLSLIAAISSFLNSKYNNLKPILAILFLSILVALSLYKTKIIDTAYKKYNLEYALAAEAVNRPLIGYNPGDVEKYALKITHMLLPVDQHRIDTLKRIKDEYNKYHTPINENRDSSLGIIGSLSFLLLLYKILSFDKRSSLATKLSILVIFSVLLSTYGGISSVIHTLSTLVFPQEFPLVQARAYNRIIVFIACFCFLYVALLIKHIFYSYNYPVLIGISVWILMLFGLFDQTTKEIDFNSTARIHMNTYLDHKNFFEKIDSQVINGSRVFMLPFIVRHNNFLGWKIWYNEPLKAYIHSNKVAWSYGGSIGSPQVDWYGQISAYPAKEMIKEISKLNFVGILVDKNGYSIDELNKLYQGFIDAGAHQLLQSADGRYEYYSIIDSANTYKNIESFIPSINYTNYILNWRDIDFKNPIYPHFIKNILGISIHESWGRWSDGSVAQIQFKKALPTHFILTITANAFGPNIGIPITIKIGTVKKSLQLTPDPQEYQLSFDIPSSTDLMEFIIPNPTSPAELGQSNDSRKLGIGFLNLKVEPKLQ